MRPRVPLIGLALAAALGGCGSAAPAPSSSSIATTSASTSASSSIASTPAASAAAPRASGATTGDASSGAATAATSAGLTTQASTSTSPPATTTPQSLPEPKRKKGPRKVSVAESSRPIHDSGGRSAAQQLVEAWRRGPVPASDPDVALVQRHLASLDAKCVESEATIAGYLRAGIERYRTHGVLESPVEFARALDSATPPGRSRCAGILRTLLAQVEQG